MLKTLITPLKSANQPSRCFGAYTFNNMGPRIRHRIPEKRASKLLNQLQIEEYERLKNGRVFSGFDVGDSITIEKLPHMSSNETDIIKGLIIGESKRNSDTSLKLMNVEFGTPIYRRVVLYSPLHKKVSLLKKNHLHDGKKPVRRAKLYYLADKSPDLYTVK